MEYSYSKGDLLNNPNTYFFSKYHGNVFIESWLENRRKFLEPKLENDLESDSRNSELDANKLLLSLLENDLEEKTKIIDLLIKRFEVTKKIYDEYDLDIRPIKKDRFQKIENYILASLVFSKYYEFNKNLPALNALLKVNDIIISLSNNLSIKQWNKFIPIVKFEIESIVSLHEKVKT